MVSYDWGMPKPYGRRGSPEAGSDLHRFPPGHAFVVKFSAAERARRPTSGRVEHVLTGRSTRFESLERLAEFFGEVLASQRIREPEE